MKNYVLYVHNIDLDCGCPLYTLSQQWHKRPHKHGQTVSHGNSENNDLYPVEHIDKGILLQNRRCLYLRALLINNCGLKFCQDRVLAMASPHPYKEANYGNSAEIYIHKDNAVSSHVLD